ncbi:MAG: tRNA dihydrouridine synthase DusB [Myxococcota bacterium]|nr:tRNA dihydrouridine synthase DusB [Myxococcota bacterium]MDP6242848.1 tRNA dihydrouridine synthase DusB [Myxococcota bacterium]MDP7434383.1 tRNA dihydrouridine synthase DusB [Myxococcota bacterium]MDP7572041.1 tRNA dihydrouridine synthase DusB [Myxococcota bacterium]
MYIGARNRGVSPAAPGEFETLRIGPIEVSPPVVLAPMAGITNAPFRTLCRGFGAGLYVSEMITARALVEGHAKTLRLAGFDSAETPRSLQLYGVDGHYTGEAVRWLVDEGRVDHIDLNFGCPVRKVTRRGGGAAVPLKPKLLRRVVRAAVRAAGDVPVTLKFRIGIDESRHTWRDAGRVAEEEGCAAVALHARTAAQHYEGEADWSVIAKLKQAVQTIPVLGNGDIWEAWDALRMLRETGCDGVVVGRGCLGRPWLFRDLADVFAGREPRDPPRFGEVAQVMREHARRLADWMGPELGVRNFRKHATWYTKGFPGSARLRGDLTRIDTLGDLERILAGADPDVPFPPDAMRIPRGKSGGRQTVALPDGYLDDLGDATPPAAELRETAAVSGG